MDIKIGKAFYHKNSITGYSFIIYPMYKKRSETVSVSFRSIDDYWAYAPLSREFQPLNTTFVNKKLKNAIKAVFDTNWAKLLEER